MARSSAEDAPLRLLLAGEDPLALAGLAAILREEVGGRSVEAVEGGEAVASVRVHRPQVVIWDAGLGGQASLEHLGSVAEVGIPILALVQNADDASAAWLAGARGLVVRGAATSTLVAALRALVEGLLVVEPTFQGSLFRSLAGEAPTLVEPLTAREREVLDLLCLGLSNREIALRLEVSEHTAKFHIHAILGKLGVHGRTEAVVRAARLGLVVL